MSKWRLVAAVKRKAFVFSWSHGTAPSESSHDKPNDESIAHIYQKI